MPALSALAARVWADEFGNTLDPADVSAELDASRSASYFLSALDHTTVLVAEHANTLVGYVQAGAVEIPEVDVQPGDAGLRRLYVDTESQGRGIGRQLLRAALDHPTLVRARRIYLTVWEENRRAVRLYESVGFRAIGKTRFTIGSEPVEDLIMVLDRTGAEAP